MIDNNEGMLSPYRVLDLSDEKGFICGKLLGDLGADVIKIEKPGGDRSRSIGPFYQNDPHPEKSLFWFAFNTNKRGITLDISKTDGQVIFKRLVKSVDFVVDCFHPGYMDKIDLGYRALERINPGVTLISITPFGQTGPHKDYKGSDIVLWAMGGHAYPFGDVDRPPVRVSHHSQAYLHAGAQAAAAAMMALHYRTMTGEGQHIDISIQEIVARLTVTAEWDQNKEPPERKQGGFTGEIKRTVVWPCKDGDVVWFYWYGPLGRVMATPLVEWMDSEGMGDAYLRDFPWEDVDLNNMTQEMVDRLAEPTERFFKAHTKAELFEGAIEKRVQLYPVSTAADIATSKQLAARGYWERLEHPELSANITYPGAFAKCSETPMRLMRRAPLIGEHNRETYEEELGMPRETLVLLKQAGVI
jgi:crotonobetainyl-CoA:carnitine CoA-transferase CaiB-like acyl-CoA transferase